MYRMGVASFIAAVLSLVGMVAGAEAPEKLAPPDAAAVRAADANVRQILRDQLAGARDPQSRAALGKKLLELADNEHDPASRYALLTRALDLAVASGDADAASNVIDEISAHWSIDALKLRGMTMSELARNLRTATDRARAARRIEAVAGQAIAADDLDLASDMRDLALSTAQRSGDTVLARQLAARASEIGRIKGARIRLKPALATLGANPSDPAASLAVGKFECFLLGNWPEGLPKLARGSDAALRKLAAQDLAAPDDGDARLALADRWWALAGHEPEPARRNLQAHAADWYRLADRQVTGLARLRAQQRVAEIDAQVAGLASGLDAATASMQILNRTNAREGALIFSQLLHDSPKVAEGAKEAVLLAYHNGSEFQHSGPALRAPAPYYSSPPQASTSNGFLFWGVQEEFPPGKYLIVYRLASLSPPGEGTVCTADLYDDDRTRGLGSRQVKPEQVPLGQWGVVCVPLDVDKKTPAEIRLLTSARHAMALDRVYIYQIR